MRFSSFDLRRGIRISNKFFHFNDLSLMFIFKLLVCLFAPMLKRSIAAFTSTTAWRPSLFLTEFSVTTSQFAAIVAYSPSGLRLAQVYFTTYWILATKIIKTQQNTMVAAAAAAAATSCSHRFPQWFCHQSCSDLLRVLTYFLTFCFQINLILGSNYSTHCRNLILENGRKQIWINLGRAQNRPNLILVGHKNLFCSL